VLGILAHKRLGQEDDEFENSSGCTGRPCLKTTEQKQNKQKKVNPTAVLASLLDYTLNCPITIHRMSEEALWSCNGN
jgi:hypothetical protein